MKQQFHLLSINSFALTICKVEKISSTNDYLKENYQNLENYFILKADYQSAGRGQFNRKWVSNPKDNLLFSILFKNVNLAKLNYIFNLILNSVKQVLDRYISNVRIKAPNDLYINDKKICGILMESRVKGDICEYLIVGIGLNVNQEIFDNLNATSLKNELNKLCDVDKLFKEILKDIFDNYEH